MNLVVVVHASEPIIWKLRDTELRWEKERETWERTALQLAKSPSVNLHIHKVSSAKAAYFEAVVYSGDRVIEYCLLLLNGKDVAGKPASSFVLMGRSPYEGTGEWELSWAIVEPPHPKAPNMDGVLPIVPQTSQADIWELLEDFEACPSAQPKSGLYEVMACVIFEDVWRPFIRSATPDKPQETFDDTKLRQPDSRNKK